MILNDLCWLKYFSDESDVTITNMHGVGFRLDVK